MISIKTCNRKDLNPIIDHLDILPPILYKYRAFDSEDHGLNYAIYGTAYFPSAKELNDPFETIFKPDSILLHLKGEKLNSYLRKKAKEHFPTADTTRINELVQTGLEQKQLLLNGDPRGMQVTLENQYSKYGILSLTAVPDSIPMWAYYSDSNKGFCVGLHTHIIAEHQDKLVHDNEIFSLQKVRYKKNLPRYNIDRNQIGITKKDLEALEATVYTKSKSWKHEKEYRLLYYDHPSSEYSFGKESVAEVIFGINVEKANKRRLIQSLSNENTGAKLLQAVKSVNSYKINFVDVKNNILPNHSIE